MSVQNQDGNTSQLAVTTGTHWAGGLSPMLSLNSDVETEVTIIWIGADMAGWPVGDMTDGAGHRNEARMGAFGEVRIEERAFVRSRGLILYPQGIDETYVWWLMWKWKWLWCHVCLIDHATFRFVCGKTEEAEEKKNQEQQGKREAEVHGQRAAGA